VPKDVEADTFEVHAPQQRDDMAERVQVARFSGRTTACC
jgi:hypothetical protein